MTHVSGRKVSKGAHKIPLTTGNYTVCFDNTFSVVTTKVVEFSWDMPKKKTGVPSVKSALEHSALRKKYAVNVNKYFCGFPQILHLLLLSFDLIYMVGYTT